MAAPATDEEAARALLAALQKRYFDATHHCSAWRLRGGLWRANDAGEPSGSAGAPILAAGDTRGLTDFVIVVTRYFGGTKLGVGGLVRAYGEAAAAALDAAPLRRGIPAEQVVVRYPYAHTAAVMRSLDLAGAAAMEHGFAADTAGGEISAVVPTANLGDLETRLKEQTSGEVAPDRAGSAILYHPVAAAAPESA